MQLEQRVPEELLHLLHIARRHAIRTVRRHRIQLDARPEETNGLQGRAFRFKQVAPRAGDLPARRDPQAITPSVIHVESRAPPSKPGLNSEEPGIAVPLR